MITQKDIFDKKVLHVGDPVWFKIHSSHSLRAAIIKDVGEESIILSTVAQNGNIDTIEIKLDRIKEKSHFLVTLEEYFDRKKNKDVVLEEKKEEIPKKDHTDCANILDAQCYHGAEIEILDGNILCIESRNCACGAFEDRIKIEYCPICGEKL